MPFITDPLEPRYAHAEDGDSTPDEMSQFEPCECGSNNPDCPECHGTGLKRHTVDVNIEGLDNLSPERLEAVRGIIRSEHENINDAMRRTQDSAERMSGGVRDNMQTVQEVNALLKGIQKSKEDRGHIHGPQCSHDGAPDHGGYSRLTAQDEHQPFGYKGMEEHEQLHRKVRDMNERIENPMAQEEVDAQYKGNPAWLDRSHLGSWNKRYAAEGFNPFHWGQVVGSHGSDDLYWKLHVPLKSGVRYLSTHFNPNTLDKGSTSIAFPNSDAGVIDRSDESNSGIVDRKNSHQEARRAHAEILRDFILHHNGELRTADEYDSVQH